MPERYLKIWDNFGAVLKEGLYEDHRAPRDIARTSRASSPPPRRGEWRSLKDYVASLKDNQTAIYYATGTDLDRLATSPQLEGFRARGIEVLLLADQVDSFWVTSGVDYEGKPFKSVTQGSSRSRPDPAGGRRAAGGGRHPTRSTAFIAFCEGDAGRRRR